jgi:hypothetical protein
MMSAGVYALDVRSSAMQVNCRRMWYDQAVLDIVDCGAEADELKLRS